MTTNYPVSLDNFVNPAGTATLASPDHAGQHSDINDAVEALQAKVGVDSSAVVTSLDYKVEQKVDKSLVDAKGDLIVASAADTVARLAVGGTNGHVLTVDSAEALGVKWAAGATFAFYPDTGIYYTPSYGAAANVNVGSTDGRTYYLPFYVPTSTTFDRIGAITFTWTSGTATVRLGIYENSNGKPTTVNLDAGTVSFTAGSQAQEITISQTLAEGWYWLAVCRQSGGVGFFGLSGNTPFPLGLMRNTSFSSARVLSWTENGITGAFATAGSLNAQTAASPTVWMRTA